MITTFDQKIAELLNNWQVEGWPVGNLVLVFIAIVLAVILCGIIGIEREWRGRSAGLRTHLLVGVGSCVIMIISIYGFPALFGEKRDVARLAAQIIAGVGFLGAGMIYFNRHLVKGLTPKSFFDKYIGSEIDEFVSIINAPTEDKPFNKSYTIDYL